MFKKKEKVLAENPLVQGEVKKRSLLDDDSPAQVKKRREPPTGSRFGAVWLLVFTILLSGIFYVWGRWSRGEFALDMPQETWSNTWEFSVETP